MQEIGLRDVMASIEAAFKSQNHDLVERLLWPAMDQFPTSPIFWFYAGGLFFAREQNALAAVCYERSIDLEPASAALGNLGACYRRLNRHDLAMSVLGKAAEYSPDQSGVWTNLAACYVNEGNPNPGIEAAEKALLYKPGFARAEWNKGLLHLERGDFDEGFKLYRSGLGKERLVRNYDGPNVDTPGDNEPEFLTRENLEDAGSSTVVTWGEQGLGDELMFASIIPELCQDVGKVIYECHPRMYPILEHAFHGLIGADKLVLIPDRKTKVATDAIAAGPIHYKLGLGDLGALYRRSRADYDRAWAARGPFWQSPDEHLLSAYQGSLRRLAEGRRIIGLAHRGGVVKTMRGYRTMSADDLAPLFELRDQCMFVCFDYEDVDAYVDHVNKTYGEGTLYFFKAAVQHFDYHHTLALVEATDALVTVCQSVAHLAAGAGHPTHVLVPSKPAWRYGLTDSEWFLYPDEAVRLYRQQENDWAPAVNAIGENLRGTVLGGDQAACSAMRA